MVATRSLRSATKRLHEPSNSVLASGRTARSDLTRTSQEKPHQCRSKETNAVGDGPSNDDKALEEYPAQATKKQKTEHKSSRTLTKEIDPHTVSFDRPAEPHKSNAPLKTPKGSRVITYIGETAIRSPSDRGSPVAKTTTGRLLDQACAHLVQVEPRMRSIVEKHHCHLFSPEGLAEEIEPFESLCSSIMSQQVSGAAAKSIKNKFVCLFSEDKTADTPARLPVFPTPGQVADCEIPFLRQAGLSQRKAEYIKGLAEKFSNGELSAEMLIKASDEEVLEKLTAVRGLGRWSVEMFACFALKRMDVFSTGDLGIQRGMAVLMGKDINKLKAKGGKWKYMSESDMTEFATKFSPYR
ncbi:MAG: hypothetical protein LQ351_004734 [Letrouitia transgressa]|nr:MAG: hypothetical protein LQ351_004734 [Letrouitia transgressa]